MRRLPFVLAASLILGSAASAQEPPPAPEEEFVPWTGASETASVPGTPAPPATDEKKKEEPGAAPEEAASDPSEWDGLSPTPPPVTAAPLAPPAPGPVVVHRPPPPKFNDVSIYGAPTLGQWKRGLGAYLGFPLLGVKAGIGVLDSVDVGLGFDSFYGVMNEPRAWVKYNPVRGRNWSLSMQLEAGAAFFTQKPENEEAGARWLTGRRNFNVEPGVIVSYRGNSPHSARLFFDARYHAALDTQPYTEDPLGGVPPPVVWGHNVPIRMGAEMPFSPSTSFLFTFGFDIHGRFPRDSAFMPVAFVGLVTGI